METSIKNKWVSLKEYFTFKLPYWAISILLVSFYICEAENMKAFVFSFLILLWHFQEKQMSLLPNWLVITNRVVFGILTTVFLLAKPIEVIFAKP